MTSLQLKRGLATALLSALLAACGGGSSNSAGTTNTGANTAIASGGSAGQALVQVAPALQYPIPDGAWSAPSGATPATGNYIYLQSDNGDYIGSGRTLLYTNADSVITATNNGLKINAAVQGNQSWNGGFLLPSAAGSLQAGYFQNLTRTPFADPAVGGVEWSGEGRGCNQIKGWVIIDKVELTGTAISALDLRFEQHCEGGAPALHGQIHWNKSDTGGQTGGPQTIPANLWQAAVGAVPATGNYMYLESRPGDYVGAGKTYTYTQSNASLKLNTQTGFLGVNVTGDQNWTGSFKGMKDMSQLAVGYYPGLSRYPFNNPVLGGLDWSGDGRGCNNLNGWFAVDKISYSGATLTAVDLRFEQYCDGSTVPLRGQLHWVANDTTTPPGPQIPVPANLWKPADSFVPPAGNFIYLVSDSGDYIGGGRTQLLTPATTSFTSISNLTAAWRIGAGGWWGNFVGMNSLSQLKPGYYADLQRYPFHNPVRGGMDWSGNGRGCNKLTGWFVVDNVSYALGELTSIDLRFEQHCEGNTPALRGAIHWAK